MSNADPRSSRLATAIRLSLEFRAQRRTDVADFLAAHAELRELLEPMLHFDDEADGSRGNLGDAATPSTAATMVEPGRQLGGYRLERELGRGGMGVVFAAWQRSLDRTVAVKVLLAPTLLVSERSLWRFQREGKLLATLDHPAIVKVIETGVHCGIPFLAMELVHGASLAAVLAAVRRAGLRNATGDTLRAAVLGAVDSSTVTTTAWLLPADYGAAVATIVARIAEALHVAHQAGVVHRDVKPSNILLRHDGQALLADFGVAHQAGAVPLTVTGDMAGTPTYMSPEQVRGEDPSPSTDVFSLGIVLYEALTLQLPFAGPDPATVVDRLLHHEPIDVRRLAGHQSPALAAIAHHALAKSPRHRYPTAAAFAADLRAALTGGAIVARPAGRLTTLWRWARREPWRAAAAGLAIAAVLSLGIADRVSAHHLQQETSRTLAALAEVQRLEIGVRLERAEEVAKTMRLPRLEELPAHERWLREDGEPLAAELPGLEQLLRTVQAEAEPYDEAAAAADRRGHPDAGQLAILTAGLAWRDSLPAAERSPARTARAAELRQAMPALQQRVAARRTWRFVDERRQFLHDELVLVVERLRKFADLESGLLAKVRGAAQFAPENHRRCLEEPQELWRTIAADVAADPRFGGLHFAPQCDLVPLGKNAQGLWEFVHLPSGETGQQVPPPDANGGFAVTAGSGIVLVLLPGGRFAMGAQAKDPDGPNYDPLAQPHEGPVQEVRLDPFFCGKYELTQAQWRRLAGDAPSYHSKERGYAAAKPTWPVDSVSQQRAMLALRSGRLLLPTEAQWEYACRAGTTSPWHFDSRADAPLHANFADRHSNAAVSGGRPHEPNLDDGQAMDIGSYRPNAFGLHDMAGGVGEHVADAMAPASRPRDAGRGEGIATYLQERHLIRGGSRENELRNLRSADRDWLVNATFVSQLVGCRAAREVMP